MGELLQQFPFLQEVNHVSSLLKNNCYYDYYMPQFFYNYICMLQLTQEFEWVLGGKGERERAEQWWTEVPSSILKQGDLEAQHKHLIAKIIETFPAERSQ